MGRNTVNSEEATEGTTHWQVGGGENDAEFSNTDGWEGAKTDDGDSDDELNENECDETGGDCE